MMAQLSRYGICYEAIQRVYRNAVVGHARRVLPEAYPDWQDRLKRAFSKEWDEAEANANERRLTGELGSELHDELDLLGVNHFHNLFEAFFDALFPDKTRESKRARQQERQAVLGWAREIRALRDPISHPSEEDLGYADAFRMLDSAFRLLQKIDSSAASQVDEWRDLLDPQELEEQQRPPLEGRLPSSEAIATRFVGRAAELDELRAWFGNVDSRRWALMGDGGKGKTAIAYEFACEIRDRAPVPCEFIIWLSAKRRRYGEGTVVDVQQPDFSDLDSALDWILGTYGWDEERTRITPEKRRRCLELLGQFPALVIVDDVDSLEGEGERAIEFFTVDGPSTRSRVLLTSRRQLFGLAPTTTVVAGFGDEEGYKFVQSRIELFDLDAGAFPENLRRRILAVTDGSPLFIEDLLRLCAAGVPANEAIRSWGGRAGDEARSYALEREFDMLSREARSVLVAAAASDEPVSLAELVAVTGLHNDVARRAVGELQRLFLLPKPRLIEEVERFGLNVNTRSLVRRQESNTDLYRSCVSGYHALSGEQLISRQRMRQVGDHIRQAVGLVKQDHHLEAEKTLQAGLQEFPNDPSLYAQLGWVYKAWKPKRRIADARDSFQRAYQLRHMNEPMYAHWAQLESDEKEWTKAAEAAERGLGMRAGSAELAFHAGYARSRLGQQLMSELQPRAEEQLLMARDHLRSAFRDPSSLTSYQSRVLQSRAYRALAITLDMLAATNASRQTPHDQGRSHGYALEGLGLLRRWTSEHPDDDVARTEAGPSEPRVGARIR
jgi:tetratricopeptide (TPR) repeat protein